MCWYTVTGRMPGSWLYAFVVKTGIRRVTQGGLSCGLSGQLVNEGATICSYSSWRRANWFIGIVR